MTDRKGKLGFTIIRPVKRTVYTDIVGMPDPLLLGITFHYYNHTDVTLYMQLQISGPNWSPNSINLGSLGSGGNAYYNWDNASSRSKPASETTEQLTLTLIGYTDAGYSVEHSRFSRTLTVIMIKSDDGSWTQDELDNFDDGTVEGWSFAEEADPDNRLTPTQAVAVDYVLSSPYSLKTQHGGTQFMSPSNCRCRFRAFKSFNTPNKAQVFAVINIRLTRYTSNYPARVKYFQVQHDSSVLTNLGRPSDYVNADYVPINKWMRIVIPLPANTTIEVRLVLDWVYLGGGMGSGTFTTYAVIWTDDFKIISK